MTEALAEACRRSVQVLMPGGRVLARGKGCLFVLHRLGYRRRARLLAAWPLVLGVECAYRLVAANRRHLGRFFQPRASDHSR